MMEWAAYYELEPFGAPTEDHRWQTLCDITHRMNSTSPIAKSIRWFDRDPEETARREAKEQIRADAIDRKLEDFFERRINASS